ncbi:pentatricopeptide repeat-containing protein At1g77360, mitochondrial [Carica papaya]|uniref:pentatricopeptide repeat-containing protein At1g77360, mitochondrial n=1 Tax=Carica papaya TaxID=3649 RepID=UPI000B8CE32D|nr:pentatricopeptide repeat-containing protein At1g77360, mitochondrial [Carica papaya]
MTRVYNYYSKLSSQWGLLARRYNSSQAMREVSETTEKICKLMMSSPPVVLDTALNQSGMRVSPEVVEEVLKRFENAGMLAYRFFEWAEKQRNYVHSVRAYHTMIGSLAKIRQYQIMWDLVNIMRNKDMLNVETFCIIMRKYTRAQKVDEAIYTFNIMEKYGIPPNLAAFNGLLSALCKSKNVRKAQEIFDSMKVQFTPDSKTYSILLEGWGKDPNLPKAREIFREMIDVGCNPDIVTYAIMVDVLCKAGRVDEAVGIVKSMDSRDCKPTSFIYSRFIPSMHTFSVLINGLCEKGNVTKACILLEEMIEKGIRPSSMTFERIRKQLIKEGREDVLKFLQEKMNLLVKEPLCD